MVKTLTKTMKITESALRGLSAEELRAFHDALYDRVLNEGCTNELRALHYAVADEVDRRIKLHIARLEKEHPEWVGTFYLDVEAMDPSDIKFDALHEYENA